MKVQILRNLSRYLSRVMRRSRRSRRLAVVLAVTFIIHAVLILLTSQFSAIFNRIDVSDFEVGKPAPRDLFVDKTITYVDEEATGRREEAVAQLVPPVFIKNDQITARVMDTYSRFAGIVLSSRDEATTAERLYLQIQAQIPGVVSREIVRILIETENMASILSEASTVLENALNAGIIDTGAPEPSTSTVSIREEEDGSTTTVSADRIIRADNVQQHARSTAADRGISGKGGDVVARLVATFSEVNMFYNRELTSVARKEAVSEVEPVVRSLVKGERIIQEGYIVSNEDARKIEAMEAYSVSVNASRIIGTVLFVAFIFLLAYVLFSKPVAYEHLSERDIFLLCAISVVYSAIVFFVVRIAALPDYASVALFLPTGLAAMLAAILVHPKTAISLSLQLSLLLLVATNFDAYATIIAFATGVAATMAVRDAKKRIDLVRASLVLAVFEVAIALLVSVFHSIELSFALASGGWAFLNGFLTGILNLGILPFLEHILNTATPFRLMELSDLNSPILKRMLTLAPGTYGHTVMVANLAESACRDIGADPLLARVGAYYHDIGKIDQAEYFVENQTSENKHNELKPSLSAAVIKSHVKIGIEKGKELGLPKEVIGIIAEHHGSQLIHYFYARALNKEGTAGNVSEKDYSYSGNPPVSREAAVVMLADAVEAISRTLKKPNIAKLERFVWKTIVEKFTNEQMSNCELTFSDLDIIKKSFVHILAGQFHSRIKYPDLEETKKQNQGAS